MNVWSEDAVSVFRINYQERTKTYFDQHPPSRTHTSRYTFHTTTTLHPPTSDHHRTPHNISLHPSNTPPSRPHLHCRSSSHTLRGRSTRQRRCVARNKVDRSGNCRVCSDNDVTIVSLIIIIICVSSKAQTKLDQSIVSKLL